ncbi:FecR family protein [uncultured Bacteroides sp.]|uniref:FecR family protein n=1 Tax=uncultured Bacteroides sp. TaxID=162156 RepID=UPI002AA7D002|nr:FecR family protein [uncultured Bacteroides sp.]
METKLLQRYIAGEATMAEKKLVIEWLNEDERNMREYMALRKLHDITLWHTDEQPAACETSGGKEGKRISYFKEMLKIAAIFAIVIAGASYWVRTKQDKLSQVMQTIRVPAGQRAELLLADGTKVWLNAQTTFSFPSNFSSKTRNVKLDGEGYFIVAKDKSKPFIVETDKYNVRVFGTEFNVIAYSSSPQFETALLNGSVEVYVPGTSCRMMLEPNTKASLVDGKLKKTVLAEFDHFLWREGIISFQDASVEDMMKQLELCFDVKIIINNSKILKNRYTGKFRTQDGVEHVLKVLQLNNKFTYKKDDDKNIIFIN